MNLLAVVAAWGCERIDKVTVIEEADISGYDSPATEIPVGFSHPIDHVWRKSQALEPDWPISTGHRTRVDGCPNIALKLDISPPRDFQGTTLNDFMRLPVILTEMPAINAIPKVVAAPLGIVTYADILPLPRGLVAL